MPLVAAALLFAGCKSEPRAERGNTAAAAETDAQSHKTIVKSISTKPSVKRAGATASVSAGASTGKSRDAKSTESIVVAHGKITHPDGSPAPGVTVKLVGMNPSRMQTMMSALDLGDEGISVQTDAKGMYEVAGPVTMGMHLQITGDIPPMMEAFDHSSLFDGMKIKRGTTRIRKDFVLLPGSNITGSVVNERGEAMAGLPVHLRPKYKQNDPRLPVATETTSSAAGSFDAKHIAAGEWIIGTRHPEYAAITQEFTAPTTGPITLQLGLRGGTVTGHVFHKDTGAAAAGLKVQMLEASLWSLNSLDKYEAKSAADGSFRFDHVSSGPRRIMVDVGENPKLGMALPMPPPVMVGEQETTDVALFVYPGHTVTGKVFDKDTQEPLAGAIISLNSMFYGGMKDGPSVASNAEGMYRLPHIFSQYGNRVQLAAELEGFIAVPDQQHSTGNSVDLKEGSTEATKDIPMVQTVKVSGIVVTKDEMPVPHAEVALFDNKTHSRSNEKVSVNPDGTFVLDCVPFVSAVIEATANGFGPEVTPRLEVSTKDIDGVKIVMEAGAAVQGRVLDPDGKPVAGAAVVQHKEYDIFTTYKEAAVTGEDGEYMLTDLPKQQTLKAKKEGYAESELLKLTLAPGESRADADLSLRQGFTITGRVTSSNGGGPVPGAHISGQGGDSQWYSASADKDGKFELKDMADSTYRVSASTSEGSGAVEGVKAGTKDLEIVIGSKIDDRSGIKFTGTVVDDLTGDPIKDFTVTESGNVRVKKLPEPGKFELEGVKVRYTYDLKINSPGYMEMDVNTDSSRSGEAVEQTFKLGKGGAITGRLVEKGTGKPVPDVVVVNWGTTEYHERQQKGPKNHTSSDQDGKFTLAPAPSGNNSVQAKAVPPFSEAVKTIEVKREQVADLGDIELEMGGTVKGVVVRGSDEEPVANQAIRLSAWTQDLQVSKNTNTDAEGRFEFAALPPMSYSVTAGNTERDVKLEAGATADVKLVLGGVTIKGTVTRGGTPVRANVGATGPGGQEISDYTDNGEYEIKDALPGSYKFRLHPQVNSNILEETVEVPDQPEFIKNFEFADCSIEVTVVDAAGEAVQGAEVTLKQTAKASNNQLWMPQDSNTLISNAEGKGKFEAASPGSYSISARHDEKGSALLPALQLANGQHEQVRLDLRAEGGRLESMALNYTTGQAVEAAWCYLYGESGQYSHSAKRDASGLLVIDHVPPGKYTTNVSAWSFSQSQKQIEIKPNETVRIEDVLYPAGSLRWRLTKADGQPAAGATVTLTPVTTELPEQPKTGKTGPAGQYVERGLATGTYQVVAQLEGKAAISETFEVKAGADTSKERTVAEW